MLLRSRKSCRSRKMSAFRTAHLEGGSGPQASKRPHRTPQSIRTRVGKGINLWIDTLDQAISPPSTGQIHSAALQIIRRHDPARNLGKIGLTILSLVYLHALILLGQNLWRQHDSK